MSVVEQRWTCPSCSRTVVIYASETDAHCCVVACQERHAKAHAAADAVFGPLPQAKPRKQTKRKAAA